MSREENNSKYDAWYDRAHDYLNFDVPFDELAKPPRNKKEAEELQERVYLEFDKPIESMRNEEAEFAKDGPDKEIVLQLVEGMYFYE